MSNLLKLDIGEGAVIIEKHFTINKDLPGRDNKFSILPEQLKDLSDFIKSRESMMIDQGTGYNIKEKDSRLNYTGRFNDNISIIIRNKNEADYIGFAIQSCIEFFNKPEIIKINNSSTDDSMDVVQNFNNRTEIKVKNIKSYKPGEAINKGVNLCSNDYILVLSGHTQIIDLNFDLIKSHLENHVAVFGKQIPVFRGKKISPGYIWTNFSDKEEVNKFSKIENDFYIMLLLYKRETLIKYQCQKSTLERKIDTGRKKWFLLVFHFYMILV